jgi:hypothetical protein
MGRIFFFMLMPGFFFSIASWMYLTIPDRYRAEVNFRSKALSTSGIVAEKNQQTTCVGGGLGACTSSCNMTVKFQTHQGRTIVFSNNCTSAKKNQTVPVLYDPETASVKARIDVGDSPESRANGDRLTSFMFALFGIGSVAVGFSIYRTPPTQT